MERYRLMGYNIENMRELFHKADLAPGCEERVQAIGRTIRAVGPHILGLVEASDKLAHHERFLAATGLTALGYRIGKSEHNRTRQDLAFYYRAPFEIVALDEQIDFYKPWIDDIDHDGIKEVCEFERAPLEARFVHQDSGVRFLVILVATKSKGVFSTVNLVHREILALANRKRLLAQAKKIRERVEGLLDREPDLPIVVMGDLNDNPGLDLFERILGEGALECLMGSIYQPSRIFHNALWHLTADPAQKKDLWTTEFQDAILKDFGNHRTWIDHILLSPHFLESRHRLQLVPGSGRIGEKTEDAHKASDHYPVHCDLALA